MKKRILYGSANHEEIVAKHGCLVDKTENAFFVLHPDFS